MSAVMIKTGIYGLLRVMSASGRAAGVVGMGAVRDRALLPGIIGVLLALAQHDLKRLLAYHSVENIGIITLGSASERWDSARASQPWRSSVSPARCCMS